MGILFFIAIDFGDAATRKRLRALVQLIDEFNHQAPVRGYKVLQLIQLSGTGCQPDGYTVLIVAHRVRGSTHGYSSLSA